MGSLEFRKKENGGEIWWSPISRGEVKYLDINQFIREELAKVKVKVKDRITSLL